jgi:Uma2 family endonuclease
MTAHALMFVDKATFYRFIQTADDQHRYEYVRGWIMQQPACGTLRHVRISTDFIGCLHKNLNPQNWIVTGSDRGIDIGSAVRYADAVVEMPGASPDSISTEAPVLILEVLSPSSEERDLTTKLAEYLSMPSLDTYIVASQDAAKCYVWQRRADGTFDQKPQTLEGREQVIRIPTLGISIPFAEVYRGIEN